DPAVPGSELLDAAVMNGDGHIEGDDASTFLEQSIAGGAITVYDAGGSPVNVQFRWAKVDSAASGGEDVWNLFYLADSNATGTDVAWINGGEDYEFNANGQLATPVNQVSIPDLEVNGAVVGDIVINH